VCREQGISEQTLNRWKKKYGGMEASDAKRLRELEEENRKLKRIVADLTVDNVALKDVLSRKW
jgi:putative transposase